MECLWWKKTSKWPEMIPQKPSKRNLVSWGFLRSFKFRKVVFFWWSFFHLHLGLEYLKSPRNWGFHDPIWAYIFKWVGTQPPTRINWYLATKLGLKKYDSWLGSSWNGTFFKQKRFYVGPYGEVKSYHWYYEQCSDQDLTTTDRFFPVWSHMNSEFSGHLLWFFIVQICRKNGSSKRTNSSERSEHRFRVIQESFDDGVFFERQVAALRICDTLGVWFSHFFPFAGYPPAPPGSS